MLISKEVEVELTANTIKYYENLGYKIERTKNRDGILTVKKGTKLRVYVDNLSLNSHSFVNVKCDCETCEKTNIIKVIAIDEKIQEVIDYVVNEKSDIEFKVCTKCGRRLPAHGWFYTKHPHGTFGFNCSCRECENKKPVFVNILNELLHPWYGNIERFTSNFRKMATNQLEKYYNKNMKIITNFANDNGLTKTDIINKLTEDEVIFMYQSLLNNEIKAFTNGIFLCSNSRNYFISLFKYLINNVLEWDREDICKNYMSDTLKKYKLAGACVGLKIGTYEILNISFDEYNIKPWEIVNSSCDWNEENVRGVKEWTKDRLKKDYNINSITEAGTYSFRKLAEEYKLQGLANAEFDTSSTRLFEYIYDEKFNKEEMLKINYNFEINTENINRTLEGSLYKVTENYADLDERGITLINQIIRFCEEKKTFPREKDLTIKNGFISRIQFYKYFDCSNFSQVYKYIIPIDNGTKGGGKSRLVDTERITPKTVTCIRCGNQKPFTGEYFCSGTRNKYGLKYECLDCASKEANRKHYAKIGVIFKNIEDISPEQWYEYYISNDKMRNMPEHCFKEENLIKIVRYISIIKEGLLSKEMLITNMKNNLFEKYKIDMIVSKLGGKVLMLQKCFTEYNISKKDFEFNRYTDEYCISLIDICIKKYNYTTEDILNGKFDGKNDSLEFKDFRSMMSYKFYRKGENTLTMFLWYFKKKEILHPTLQRQIVIYDFNYTPEGFYNLKDNRVDRIKFYCEEECKESILKSITETEQLKKWIFKYFKVDKLSFIMNGYNRFGGVYDILVEAYPIIKEDNILFDWEWHQFNKNDNETLIRELKEFILYRMNEVIINKETDIPKYININNMGNIYSKLNKQIDKKRFSSYYEWCCLAFPEYKEKWTKEMFGMIVSYDGIAFDSYQEKDLYEHIKENDIFKYIKPMGRSRSGKYTYDLGDEYDYNRFCPDFVIEYVSINNVKRKLAKPIIIEFYGMYDENNPYYIYINYVKKTKAKERFYKSNDDIYYIGIFPQDIKKNYLGLKSKLESFFASNFNINIWNLGDNYTDNNLIKNIAIEDKINIAI